MSSSSLNSLGQLPVGVWGQVVPFLESPMSLRATNQSGRQVVDNAGKVAAIYADLRKFCASVTTTEIDDLPISLKNVLCDPEWPLVLAIQDLIKDLQENRLYLSPEQRRPIFFELLRYSAQLNLSRVVTVILNAHQALNLSIENIRAARPYFQPSQYDGYEWPGKADAVFAAFLKEIASRTTRLSAAQRDRAQVVDLSHTGLELTSQEALAIQEPPPLKKHTTEKSP